QAGRGVSRQGALARKAGDSLRSLARVSDPIPGTPERPTISRRGKPMVRKARRSPWSASGDPGDRVVLRRLAARSGDSAGGGMARCADRAMAVGGHDLEEGDVRQADDQRGRPARRPPRSLDAPTPPAYALARWTGVTPAIFSPARMASFRFSVKDKSFCM